MKGSVVRCDGSAGALAAATAKETMDHRQSCNQLAPAMLTLQTTLQRQLTCAAAPASGRARCQVGWSPSPPLHTRRRSAAISPLNPPAASGACHGSRGKQRAAASSRANARAARMVAPHQRNGWLYTHLQHTPNAPNDHSASASLRHPCPQSPWVTHLPPASTPSTRPAAAPCSRPAAP